MSTEVQCRCCGVPVGPHPFRQQVRVCMDCDSCDRLHGAQLQGVLAKAVADGKLQPYTAIARAMIDDAQLTGRLEHIVLEDGKSADVRITNPPPRWLVVMARSICRGEMPDMLSVVDAVVFRYVPGRITPTIRRAFEAELRDALHAMDPEIMDVEIESAVDVDDPGHLVIKIGAKVPVLGMQVGGAEHVDVPADIMSRKRAEA